MTFITVRVDSGFQYHIVSALYQNSIVCFFIIKINSLYITNTKTYR